MVTIEPKEIDVKLNLVGLNVYEEQITRINQKLEKPTRWRTNWLKRMLM